MRRNRVKRGNKRGGEGKHKEKRSREESKPGNKKRGSHRYEEVTEEEEKTRQHNKGRKKGNKNKEHAETGTHLAASSSSSFLYSPR